MQLESQTASMFMNYLKEHGYPENSIAAEYQVGERSRADIVILDPETKTPIQIFELKSRKTPEIIRFGKEQIQKYKTLLKSKDIPAYLVFPSNIEPFFEVIKVDDTAIDTGEENETNIRAENSLLFNFSSQKNARLSKEVVTNKEKQKEVIDNFKIVCWILALIVCVLGLLSKFKIIEITTTDMTLLGAAISLVLIPFASKLKFLGIEFERLTKK